MYLSGPPLFFVAIKNLKFKCDHSGCEYESADFEDAKAHLQAHGPGDRGAKYGGPYKCDLCGDVFTTKLELHSHRSANHKESVFKCQNCTFETYDKTAFENHLKQNHPDVAVLLGYMTQEQANSKAVGDAMKSSDIYSKKSSNIRTVKECPFCKGFCTFKNDRLINHIKKSHADVTVQRMQQELKKILSKSDD